MIKDMFKSVFGILVLSLLSLGCSEANKPAEVESTPAKPETAFPASGYADNNVFFAKGEVVVFFEPALEDAKKMSEAGGEEFQRNKRAFQAAKSAYIDQLEAMGINAYSSREKNIKINVSESQFYVVHAGGVKEGYGVALAKLNEQPKLIHGIPSWEELEKEVKAYYKK